jgi:general secretion pathway protein A
MDSLTPSRPTTPAHEAPDHPDTRAGGPGLGRQRGQVVADGSVDDQQIARTGRQHRAQPPDTPAWHAGGWPFERWRSGSGAWPSLLDLRGSDSLSLGSGPPGRARLPLREGPLCNVNRLHRAWARVGRMQPRPAILRRMYAPFFGLQPGAVLDRPGPALPVHERAPPRSAGAPAVRPGGGGGFVLLTGEIGAGKTTVCRCFLEQLPATARWPTSSTPSSRVAELLQTVCERVRHVTVAPGETQHQALVDALNRFLLEAHAAGRQACVLVIDEAQSLSADVLEQLRLLTNLETAERKLLQIILIGQPELRDLLARPALEQLAQRVIARYHLGPLSPPRPRTTCAHRLAVAGPAAGPAASVLFDPAALAALHRLAAVCRGASTCWRTARCWVPMRRAGAGSTSAPWCGRRPKSLATPGVPAAGARPGLARGRLVGGGLAGPVSRHARHLGLSAAFLVVKAAARPGEPGVPGAASAPARATRPCRWRRLPAVPRWPHQLAAGGQRAGQGGFCPCGPSGPCGCCFASDA